MSHTYVIVQSGTRIELISGAFEGVTYGDKVKRDEKVHGSKPWIVVKKFNFDETRRLNAIETLGGFSELRRLFLFDVQ